MDNHNQSLGLSFGADLVIWNINSKEAVYNIPGGVFIIILIILGIPGNGLVIYVYSYHFKPSTVNLLIKVLAVLDAICCVFGMTYEMVDLFFPVLNGELYTCKIFRTIEQAGEFISCEILLLIAYDRYLHVCKPFNVFSISKAKRLVYIAVAIGFILSCPTLFVIGKSEEVIRGIRVYGCNRDTNNLTTFIYYLCINCVFVLSLIIIIIHYVCIWSSIHKWKHTIVGQTSQLFATSISKQGPLDNKTMEDDIIKRARTNSVEQVGQTRIHNMGDTERNKRRMSSLKRRKIVKPIMILFGVTFVFVISYVPYFILVLLENTKEVTLNHLSVTHHQIWELFYKSYFLGNVLNPVIYGIFDHRFRQKCFEVLFKPKHFERVCC